MKVMNVLPGLFVVSITLLASVRAQGTNSVSITASSPDESQIGGVLIAPLMYRENARSGQKGELEFRMAAPGLNRATVQMEILSFLPEDWTYASHFGQTHPRDASSWFAERDTKLEFMAGEKKTYVLKYRVPPRTSGSYWCMLRCQPQVVGASSAMSVTYEIPLIFTIGKRDSPVVVVSSPVLGKSGGTRNGRPVLEVMLPVQNDGEGFTPIGATGEVRNLTTGRVIANMSLPDRNLFPGTKRRLYLGVPHLSDGRYRLSFRAEIGARRLPPISADYNVVKGEPVPASEASSAGLTPVVIDPPGFSVIAMPGGRRSQTLRLTNISQRSMELDILPKVVEQAKTGSIGLGDDGLPADVSVDVSPTAVALAPGQMQMVRLTVSSTREAKGGVWFGLAVAERNNDKTFAETVLGEMLLKGTEAPKLELEGGQIEMFRGRPAGISFTIKNSGNVALRPDATAVVLESGVQLVERLSVPVLGEGTILPGTVLPNAIMLPDDLAAGQYIVEIAYQYGEQDYARLRVPITVGAASVAKKKAVAPKRTIPAKAAPKQKKAAGGGKARK